MWVNVGLNKMKKNMLQKKQPVSLFTNFVLFFSVRKK